jgi:hypothetical protein
MPKEHREFIHFLAENPGQDRAFKDFSERIRGLYSSCIELVGEVRSTHRTMVAHYLHGGCQAATLTECCKTVTRANVPRNNHLDGVHGTGGTPGGQILGMLDQFTSDTKLRMLSLC